jgi:ATP-dependent Lon protease
MESRQRQPSRPRRVRTPSEPAGVAHGVASLRKAATTGLRELPVLPLRNTVLLPNMVVPLYVERDAALRAVEAALAADQALLVVAQRDEAVENPTADDLYTVGTECAVTRTLRMPDGSTSVLVHGIRRVRIEEWLQFEPHGRVLGLHHEDEEVGGAQVEALMRSALAYLEMCSKFGARMSEDAYIQALNIAQPGALADFIVAQLEPPLPVRQETLEAWQPVARLRAACKLLQAEVSVLELEQKIRDEVQHEADRGQRDFFLREQLKVIQRELGEQDPATGELDDLRRAIAARRMPEAIEARALKEFDRLKAMPAMAPEAGVVRTYLDWLVALPWQNTSRDCLDLKRVAAVLDERHYGLQAVKDRILEFIAVRKLAPSGKAPILCLVGPPGVGKTSLGRSVAEALGRPFARISLGGVRDEAEIRGHRRTYVGALPGRVIQAMKTVAVGNPVLVLDEIDKLAADYRGDPSAALLEVLDPEQNATFSDHYLEVPYDLSKALFILTANVLHTIPAPLRDRMEIIEISGYTEDEKLGIARRFILPKLLVDSGLRDDRVEFTDDALRAVIRDYTFEAGVRNLEREIAAILRRVARRVVEGRRAKVTVTPQKLSTYLGPQKFYPSEAEERDEVGVATGLAWTAAGGDLTTVEVSAVPGNGALQLTGQLGDVMKESAQAALTYTRGRAEALGLDVRFYQSHDFHIHLPSGGIPKDGPSAGVTMATAIISALTGATVRRDVAMTGEITLRGRVLPVGGVKEKVLAAYRAGISTVLLPRRNLRDLDDLHEDARSHMTLLGVETMDDVLAIALAPSSGRTGSSRYVGSPNELLEPRSRRAPAARQDPLAAAGRIARSRVSRGAQSGAMKASSER